LTCRRIPHTNVVDRACCEKITVARGERNIIDLFIMAGVTQLGIDSVSVTPVDGGLVGTGKEMGVVGGQADGGDSTHDLGLLLDGHELSGDLGNGTVAGSDHNVIVLQ